jgi:hypothetical protein
MMNGAAEAPPTIESLQAELARTQQLLALVRQQRDQALSAANDLQAQFLMLQQEREAQPPGAPLLQAGPSADEPAERSN